jgi:hypothetical protein
MNVFFYILSILFKAIGDGLNDSGKKGIGHSLQALSFVPLLIAIHPIWYVAILSYGFLMIAFFDYTYNLSRGLKWNFVGTTSWWDNAIKRVPFGFMLFVRVICLVVGIFLIIN